MILFLVIWMLAGRGTEENQPTNSARGYHSRGTDDSYLSYNKNLKEDLVLW
jgi:hypothetical protein